jgi:methionyl-tRNA formyltransferase
MRFRRHDRAVRAISALGRLFRDKCGLDLVGLRRRANAFERDDRLPHDLAHRDRARGLALDLHGACAALAEAAAELGSIRAKLISKHVKKRLCGVPGLDRPDAAIDLEAEARHASPAGLSATRDRIVRGGRIAQRIVQKIRARNRGISRARGCYRGVRLEDFALPSCRRLPKLRSEKRSPKRSSRGGNMRVAVIGQQDFGKAVLEAFLARGDEVAGVFVAPEKPGARPDPLRAAAEAKGLKVLQVAKFAELAAHDAIRGLKADIGIMAYVLSFVPRTFCEIPKHGTIQFHPSLLPLHRGPSSINWPIIKGFDKTGLTIFRPTDGLDEGPIVLQREVGIGTDDTLGSVYFEKLFPLGVKAMLEAADLVVAGNAKAVAQDESKATYEGWVREAEAKINWASPIDQTYNLIRGCNPQPGAWTTLAGRKLYIYDARKIAARTFGEVRGKKIGQVAAAGGTSIAIHGQGGFVEVLRCRFEDGKKIAANEAGIPSGAIMGT